MPNPLKAKLKTGAACLNGWSSLPSPASIEFFAQGGFDSITIDLQHGLHDYASAVACMQAMAVWPVTPLARSPWNEPGIIGKLLDAGAWGIICPMINSAADARALVKACYYPRLGERSNGPIRAGLYGGRDNYQRTANDEVLVLPQIETGVAVDNLEAILDTDGVGGVYVGPSDLGLSIGLPATMDREEPSILGMYARIVEATTKRGLVPAIHTAAPAYARRMIDMGFTLVTVASDANLIAGGAVNAVRAVKAEA